MKLISFNIVLNFHRRKNINIILIQINKCYNCVHTIKFSGKRNNFENMYVPVKAIFYLKIVVSEDMVKRLIFYLNITRYLEELLKEENLLVSYKRMQYNEIYNTS